MTLNLNKETNTKDNREQPKKAINDVSRLTNLLHKKLNKVISSKHK